MIIVFPTHRLLPTREQVLEWTGSRLMSLGRRPAGLGVCTACLAPCTYRPLALAQTCFICDRAFKMFGWNDARRGHLIAARHRAEAAYRYGGQGLGAVLLDEGVCS